MQTPPQTTEQKLAWFFLQMWRVFVDGGSLDGFEVQKTLERSGLTEWRSCTAEEVARLNCDIEEGDPALFLTDEGKRVTAIGHEVEKQRA